MPDDIAKIEQASVQTHPDASAGGMWQLFASFAMAADGMTPWGQNPIKRDQELRAFYKSEPWLVSTVSSLAARNGAFSWTLEGPPRTSGQWQDRLHESNFGKGWVHLMQQVSIDLMTQDNGAFVEIIRQGESPLSPVLGLAHLDAGRCQRTGNLEYPVVYRDRDNNEHKLAAYQVIDFVDCPSTEETMNGVGICAVSRALTYAQILRDVAIYQLEKVSGRNPAALHVVSGVDTQRITDVLEKSAQIADDKQQLRFQLPAVMGTLDPTAKVEIATILLKSLPDGFTMEEWMKWFIALMALAFGCEYQDLAPLPGGGLGTSQQSTVLHMKAKGKGPELFRKMVEHKLNFAVLPENVTFKFTEEDFEAQQVQAGVRKTRAETRQIRIASGEITPEVARQIAQDDGDLKPEYLDLLATADATPDDVVTDDEQQQEPGEVRTDQTIAEGQQPAPQAAPKQPAQQMPASGQAKELTDDDYYGKQRAALEAEYTEEMTKALAEVRAEIEKRLKVEIANASD
jgi:hypothetical protein